jgi:hypothetical protein
MLHKYIERKPTRIAWILISSLLVACNSVGLATSQATATPIVEYGASLAEWQAAKQAAGNNALLPTPTAAGVTAGGPLTNTNWLTSTENSAMATAEAGVSSQPTNSGSAPSTSIEEAGVNGSNPASASGSENEPTIVANEEGYLELNWDDLVPEDYQPEAIMARYQEELNQFEDGDPEAMTLYLQMQEEFNNAPVNEFLNNKLIKLPGFIAPLEYADGIITEFLLVPYFGACIHVPPPPVNQTILVKAAEGYAIKFEESYNPFWVSGELVAESATTDLADAGYYVENAIIEPYTYSTP